jgi:hypothetical protein
VRGPAGSQHLWARLHLILLYVVHTQRFMNCSMGTSEAADQAGVNDQTIRYYERRGLLPAPPRWTSGYRDLSLDSVRRIRPAWRAQSLRVLLDAVVGDVL